MYYLFLYYLKLCICLVYLEFFFVGILVSEPLASCLNCLCFQLGQHKTVNVIYIAPLCRLVAEMCYIWTLLLLMWSSTLSVAGLADCPRHIHYTQLPVVMGGM